MTKCEVDDMGESVTDALADSGWDKAKLVASLVLSLCADNEKIAVAEFFRGGWKRKTYSWRLRRFGRQ